MHCKEEISKEKEMDSQFKIKKCKKITKDLWNDVIKITSSKLQKS